MAEDAKLATADDPQALTSLSPAAEPVGVIPTEDVPVLQGTRVATEPSRRTLTGEPLQSGHKGKSIVRTRHPVDLFEHGVEGVEPITAEGVEVGPSKVDALLEAARTAAVELEVVG